MFNYMNSIKFVLGHQCPKETLYTEYKEFCLQVQANLFYTESEILTILETGVLAKNYNSLIYQSLDSYFANTFPKNIVAFLNAGITGDLYLGINDDGEVTGIPFLGSPNITTIKKHIHNNLSNYIVNYQNIKKYVDTEVCELGVNKSFLDNSVLNDLILKYKTKKKLKLQRKKKYEFQKQIWLANTSIYEKKIVDLINSEPCRSELKTYITEQCTNERVKVALVNELSSPNNIAITNYNREDINSILSWGCKFKDAMLEEMMKLRPKKPQTTIRIHPELIFNKISPLRLKFIENNPTLKYYIIRVHVKAVRIPTEVYYVEPYNKKHKYKIRRLSGNEPYCSCL